jgi:hypothetical protein
MRLISTQNASIKKADKLKLARRERMMRLAPIAFSRE